MRAYLRGGDRDQPAFSYAFEKAVMAPCRRAAAGSARREESCGLSCGQGFVNLVGHAASNDCAALQPGAQLTHSTEFDRPAWSAKPPEWLCRSGDLAAGAKTSLLGHSAPATP